MEQINLSVQGNETAKTAYEKPTMCVYELEVEGAVMTGSGQDTLNGGAWGNEEE